MKTVLAIDGGLKGHSGSVLAVITVLLSGENVMIFVIK